MTSRIRFTLLALFASLWTTKVVGLAVFGVAALVASAPGVTQSWDLAMLVSAAALTLAWAVVARVPARRAEPAASGLPLDAGEQRVFRSELEQVARATHGRAPQRVSATFDGTVDAGRGGELVIGLPVLFAVTREELRALGALLVRPTRRDRRFDDWAARLAAAWEGYASNLAAHRSRTAFLSRRVAPALARRLTSASASLTAAGRAADLAAAADLCGPELVASALVKTQLAARYVDEVHWPAVWGRSDLEPEPPHDAIESMRAPLGRLGQEPLAAGWLEEALDHAAAPPTLREGSLRSALGTLGIAPELPEPCVTAAADALVGDGLQALLARATAAWQAAVADAWEGERAQGAAALARYELQERHGVLPAADVLAYAALVERYRGAEAARPLYERAVEQDENDPQAVFGLGRLLLAEEDDDGLELLERAVALDAHAAGAAGTLAADYLEGRGRHDEAAIHRARAADHAAMVDAAERERRSLDAGDRLTRHGLEETSRRALETFLASFDEIDRAFLARKDVRYLADEWPAYVLGVVRKDPGWRRRTVAHQELADDVFARSPVSGIAWVVTNTDGHAIERLFRGVPGTLVFRRHRQWYRRKTVWVVTVFAALTTVGALAEESPPPQTGPEPASAVPRGVDHAPPTPVRDGHDPAR
jgi:hypothetical protein